MEVLRCLEAPMSEDIFTEVTEESWFGRLGKSIVGILFGIVLFVAAFPLLFWNEGRAVKRYKTLKEGSGVVVSVEADRLDRANQDKLVHMTGFATTDEVLLDSEFQVEVNGLRMKRIVEMYQWKEEKESRSTKKVGGGKKTVTTYKYRKTWSSNVIDSSHFKKPSGHTNPDSMPFRSGEYNAKQATIGTFDLPVRLVRRISNFERMSPGDSADLSDSLGVNLQNYAGGYYLGRSPGSPEIGDSRIHFEVVKPTTISLVAKQVGNTFSPYQTQAGGSIELLKIGTYSADALFQKAHTENKILTWILRGAGFMVMLIGLGLVLRPLSVVADVIPIFASIVGAGTGIVAFLLAAALSLITVAVAWVTFRPLLGGALLAGAAAMILGGRFISKRRSGAVPESSSPTPAGKVSAKGKPAIAQGSAAHSSVAATPKPTHPRFSKEEWVRKGQDLFRSGRYHEAIQAFSRVIKEYPQYALAYYNRGVAYHKLGKNQQLLTDLKVAAGLGNERAQKFLKSKGIAW
jgi:tetratricopeptide (TPR) repeat protein